MRRAAQQLQTLFIYAALATVCPCGWHPPDGNLGNTSSVGRKTLFRYSIVSLHFI